MILKGVSDLTPNMKQFYGSNDFIANTIHQNPMKIVSLDEAGPFYLLNSQREHDKTYILVCVELLTYKCHLIPLPRLNTLSFIRVLEILQSHRGHITTIILDNASFHNPLRGCLDPAPMREFFNNGLANYCQLMLGEECPPVKGCGFSGLCRPDESCRNNSELGFQCTKGNS